MAVDSPHAPRDPYRFGHGDRIELHPGTVGWHADDLEDPAIVGPWDAGKYEIVEGVLTELPGSVFAEGRATAELAYAIRDYCRDRGLRCESACGVNVALRPTLVLRPDMLVIVGDDFARVEALEFPPPRTRWEDHVLGLPPTLVIESSSPRTEHHDRVAKREWYARFGVMSYWIADGFGETLECLRLAGGAYELDAVGRGDEVVTPGGFPGLAIDLKTLWT